jgi:hypothetical protein
MCQIVKLRKEMEMFGVVERNLENKTKIENSQL